MSTHKGLEKIAITGRLATSQNRRDEVPNVELAQHIALRGDKRAIAGLIENLDSKDRNIQGDCIKVLYEVGERKPALIAAHTATFARLLDSRNNRLAWGAMTAIDSVALESPKAVLQMLDKIIAAADAGSVITRDHAVSILTKLASLRGVAAKVTPLLLEQLRKCPSNQLPMYSEKAAAVMIDEDRGMFADVLTSRLRELRGAKRSRVERVITRLGIVEKRE
jgi:hypothetical protein